MYLHTKNPNFGYIFEDLRMQNSGLFNGHLVYFVVIWYGQFVHFVVVWCLFPFFVYYTNENLATLAERGWGIQLAKQADVENDFEKRERC
jgi:hypothetical protein